MSHPTSNPLFTTLRFIPNSGSPSAGTKRNAAHACNPCRKKKKRCTHTPDAMLVPPHVPARIQSSHTPATSVGISKDTTHDRVSIVRSSKRPRTSDATSRGTTRNHSRFIGDLNPDVELLSGSTPNEPLRNNVGVWHSDDSHSSKSSDGRDMFQPSSLFHIAPQSTQTLLSPLIEELCLSMRPPLIHFQAMEQHYFESIDPILPAIDTATYHNSSADSHARILQEQIICILASLNPVMAEHLMLQNSDILFSPAEYGRKVVGSMRLTIECSLVSDKAVLIRALIAMSLVTSGPESIDLTSQYFVRAVHLGYTIGLHLPQDQTRDQRVAGLFCYIWSVDRLYAAVQGRPIFMHAVDLAKYPRDCMVSQSPGFQVLVYTATLLDKTIALYRPGAMEKEIPDFEYPTFEEIATDCGALGLPSNLLSTLELFYHAVGILSCRHRSGSSSQGCLARNARQSSSAMQISSIMDENPIDTLVLLPFVPYAVSLALSTAYRDLKHCKTANNRSRARRRFVQANSHLLSLGRVFWSAAFVSELATKILKDTEIIGETSKVTPRSNLSQTREHSTSVQDAPQAIDVTLGHEWNTENMDQFFADNLDPSQPWDIEGFLAFSGLENPGS